ncbi:MAG: glycine-rich protein [Chloroflexota bacterium]
MTSVDLAAIGGMGATAVKGGSWSGTPGTGGFGANVSGTLAVTPGQTLYIEVGQNGLPQQGGFNGGGSTDQDSGDQGGGGGGASDVRTTSCGSPCNRYDFGSLNSRLLVAGGGGGGGATFNDNGGSGGSAGSTAGSGQDGTDSPSFPGSAGKGGGGAATSFPGAGGSGGDCDQQDGTTGHYGDFGNGGDTQPIGTAHEPGGGGGGGYYGGGAGGSGARCSSGAVAGGGGGGAGSSYTDPSVTSPSISTDATGVPSITITYTATDQPDGRIRVGSHHYIGGDIYNSDGTGQSIAKNAVVGSRILFRIQVQNDGNGPDSFTFQATGSAAPGYAIRYYWKSTEITSAVVAGTFTTPALPQGYKYTIEAWVKVTSTAGPSASRLVTITSVGDNSKVDAVRFQVNRSN